MRRLCALLMAMLAAVPAQGQGDRSDTHGLSLSLHLLASSINVDDDALKFEEEGGGLGATVTYGISQRVAVYATVDGSVIESYEFDDFSLLHLDVGSRLHFLQRAQPLRPYVDLAITGRMMAFSEPGTDVSVTGTGLTIGGGLKYFFSPQVAFESGLTFTFGSFDELSVAGRSGSIAVDATTGRIHLGLTWFPLR